ncbi:Rer1-domain-containing protein [Trametes coccinea BRFM310]|uniref:Rer1-domain-containing protein n=1 Tax=Trametes coccinea (strain BRFM310) TaxID=1353009 RepID=A0A1Y2IGE3_TRAC3|nr:Rer1-domain-containing protein [Trametes coccinea BRFM310]
MFDVPVYWSILGVYWIVLILLTMRRQIQHMIKYKYISFEGALRLEPVIFGGACLRHARHVLLPWVPFVEALTKSSSV